MIITQLPLKEIIVNRLRQEIFEGNYKPGERLIEQSLADQYGVSRGPIREALVQLEREGLAQVIPRRGALVTEVSMAEAREIYTLRGHLEGLAVRLAVEHWTDEHGARLGALVAEMAPLGPQDWPQAVEIDQRFHHLIVEASGSRTLFQTYQSLDSKVVACFLAVKRYLGVLPVAMASRHSELTLTLQQKNFARAEILAIDHWTETAARFQSLVPNG
jgi:DNA-binding GntR family transcriptional regulator